MCCLFFMTALVISNNLFFSTCFSLSKHLTSLGCFKSQAQDVRQSIFAELDMPYGRDQEKEDGLNQTLSAYAYNKHSYQHSLRVQGLLALFFCTNIDEEWCFSPLDSLDYPSFPSLLLFVHWHHTQLCFIIQSDAPFHSDVYVFFVCLFSCWLRLWFRLMCEVWNSSTILAMEARKRVNDTEWADRHAASRAITFPTEPTQKPNSDLIHALSDF